MFWRFVTGVEKIRVLPLAASMEYRPWASVTVPRVGLLKPDGDPGTALPEGSDTFPVTVWLSRCRKGNAQQQYQQNELFGQIHVLAI